MLSLNTALDLVSGMVPVPGLAPALTLLKFIIASVEQTRASQKQLAGLTITLAQLLATINTEFQSSKLIEASCIQPLEDLRSVLLDVNRFVQKEQGLNFFRSLFRTEARISEIEMFYRRIDATASAFQISASLNIQANLRDNERARQEDAVALNGRFTTLESNNVELKQALDINQKSTRALIVSLERRIGRHEGSNPERKFLSHTLQYLASTSSEQVKVEDWMISPFDVDHGQEIGSGGFGTVYKGTWNRTQVAIKLIRNQSGVAASADLLRKEIDIWMTLRHPNILQFLGANTLDDQPFVVMPLMPYNSRQFLRAHRDYDPLVILRDISLGLEYLHARKISHGDLKGINVLVEDSGRALLCDFGLTRIKADITSRTHAAEKVVVSGSRNWMAPEMLSGTLPRPSSDLYAFGMTIYELFMDEIPLSAIPYSDFIELVFKFGTRPQRPDPDDCPRMTDDIWNLAVRCWDKDPHVRPTARQIHDNINLLTTGSARGGAQRNPSIIPVKRHVSNPFPSTSHEAAQSNDKPILPSNTSWPVLPVLSHFPHNDTSDVIARSHSNPLPSSGGPEAHIAEGLNLQEILGELDSGMRTVTGSSTPRASKSSPPPNPLSTPNVRSDLTSLDQLDSGRRVTTPPSTQVSRPPNSKSTQITQSEVKTALETPPSSSPPVSFPGETLARDSPSGPNADHPTSNLLPTSAPPNIGQFSNPLPPPRFQSDAPTVIKNADPPTSHPLPTSAPPHIRQFSNPPPPSHIQSDAPKRALSAPPARQSQIEGSESSPPPSGLPSNVTHPKHVASVLWDYMVTEQDEPIQENSLTVKIVTSETFRQHEGFDLACFEGKNWLISVLPTFSVDEQELYSTFKRKVAEYFKHPIHQFRLWVQTRRDNKIRRPEFWIRELGDSALTVGHIKQDEDPEGSNLYLYLDLLGESTTATPSADTILVFLKYFDLTRQQLRGYDTVQIPRSSKAKALVQLIQQKMGSLATKALNLYQEIGPSTVKLLDLNLSFVESEMVDGDVVCFERQDASSMPLETPLSSNAIQFYESLQYRVNLLFRPRKPMSALNVALPRFSFIIDRRETYSSMEDDADERFEAVGLSSGEAKFMSTHVATGLPKNLLLPRLNLTIEQMLDFNDQDEAVVLYEYV